MNKMYKVCSFWTYGIIEVTVVRQTEHTVWYQREGFSGTSSDRKETQSHRFFESREEAIDFCLTELQVKLHRAQEQLKQAERNIIEFKSKNDIHG